MCIQDDDLNHKIPCVKYIVFIVAGKWVIQPVSLFIFYDSVLSGVSLNYMALTPPESLVPSQCGGQWGVLVGKIWIVCKPRTAGFLEWRVKGVFRAARLNSEEVEGDHCSAGLGSDHESWKQEGFRISFDHLKGSDSRWQESGPCLMSLGKAFIWRGQSSFWCFLKRITANLPFPQGQTSSLKLVVRGDEEAGVCLLRYLPGTLLCLFKPQEANFFKEEIWRNNSLLQLEEQSLKDKSVQ